jgi:hypothetical protein
MNGAKKRKYFILTAVSHKVSVFGGAYVSPHESYKLGLLALKSPLRKPCEI